MFKFNFSSDSSTQETSFSNAIDDTNKPDLQWDEAKELDLQMRTADDLSLDCSDLRVMSYDEVTVKLLKREIALFNIMKDQDSPLNYTIEAEQNDSDLLPAKYEGGLKLWECSEDLADYMVRQLGTKEIKDKDILDLGCGAGLVGVVAMNLGAKTVLFQDYNQEVLTHWTCSNVSLNYDDIDTSKSRCKFWSGDWDSFSDKYNGKFDMIFTSETVYNPDNYGKLCRIFKKHMKQGSIIYLAAKSVYFSLGGSVQLFLSEINKDEENFVCKQVFKSDEGVQRVIIEIKQKSQSNH